MAETDDRVLHELRALRAETDALRKIVVRAVELLGRVNEGVADVRADIVALRADLARVQGDVLLLRGELEPLERIEHDPEPVILEHPDEDLSLESRGEEGTVDEP